MPRCEWAIMGSKPWISPVCLDWFPTAQCISLARNITGDGERCRLFDREAAELRANIQDYMWDARAGYFLIITAARKGSFMSLAPIHYGPHRDAGAAGRIRNQLPRFETSYGLTTTDRQTGMSVRRLLWAPMVYFAVEGLRRYGFEEDAQRIARKFIDVVRSINEETGANFEKSGRKARAGKHTKVCWCGYSENVVGFGWTNGTTLVLQKWLRSIDANSAVTHSTPAQAAT